MATPRSRRFPAKFAAAVVVLLALHVYDPWGGQGPLTAWGLPWDLVYHLLWMLAATALVLVMTYRVWPDDPPP
jgi:low affinity Fe/Cu permease